jgi:hypothetical protein
MRFKRLTITICEVSRLTFMFECILERGNKNKRGCKKNKKLLSFCLLKHFGVNVPDSFVFNFLSLHGFCSLFWLLRNSFAVSIKLPPGTFSQQLCMQKLKVNTFLTLKSTLTRVFSILENFF